MRQTVRLVILGVATAVVLATIILAVLYVQYGRQIPRTAKDGTPAVYTLGEWKGQLAVFKGESAFPMKLYEVPVASLPAAEQQKLKDGISVATAGELQLLLEDYTS